jgi:ATP-dependent Clp protease ATP-binding subunit ClpA
MEQLKGTVRRTIERARQEAIRTGSRSIDAEHLLLALAAEPEAAKLLGTVALDEAALRTALRQEWVQSLAVAGVTLPIPEPTRPDPRANPRAGESLKAALRRAHEAAAGRGVRRIGSADLLLGVLMAQQGTVPRALAQAGVVPGDVATAVERALASG